MTGKETKKHRHDGPGARSKAPDGQASPAIRASKTDGPVAVISQRAADRLRAGHVWVYRSDVLELPDDAPHLLPVADQRGILLGTALYSSASEIALRLVSTDLIASESEWLELLDIRLRAAIALRKGILSTADTNACRLVFSEADALPGNHRR